MKITRMQFLMGAILLACSCVLWAQQGTANRNVILRRDPSTGSPALEHLDKGSRVTLVDATSSAGFFHVRTEDDQVGWVYAKYISLSEAPTPPPEPSTPSGPQCDATLLSHVYHSQRLIVKKQCAEVTGIIVDATNGRQSDGVRHEKDGDTHGWLKVDSQFQDLLNAGNLSDEGGNLVFEIVCRFPVTQPDAKSACQGYTDTVKLPPVGSHVRIVGTYVQDTFHAKWMEIHPVTSITVVP
jgi:SH3 domain-containing protein